MTEPEFLLQFLVIPLDAPAQLGEIDQIGEGNVLRERGEPILARLILALGPLDQQPLLFSWFLEPLVAVRGTHAHSRVTRCEPVDRAFPPRDRLPGGIGQARSEEHTSELQSLMRTSYAVFCLQTKTQNKIHNTTHKT